MHPNIVLLLCDQLRARSTPPYETQVPLPGMDAMRAEGMSARHALSTYPICTPYRGMLMTGRHPQTTGMIVNFTSVRSSEIGLGDAFAAAGYRTGYVGKWHLHRGGFPNERMDWIPEGRARLGFDYWRAYNCHADFWDGHLNGDDWNCIRWKGYETQGLMEYAREFVEQSRKEDRPYLLVVAPHQPHWNWAQVCAPEEYYQRLPAELTLPGNVPEHYRETALEAYRHYLAMTMAVDDMIIELRRLVGEDALFVFTSDHGTNMGAHALPGEQGQAWGKSRPHEECIHVPFHAVWPGHISAGSVTDELITPVDVFPTLCGLAGIPVPRTVEGVDLSASFLGGTARESREAALIMNMQCYAQSPNWIKKNGLEWRGVRTRTHTYARWCDGTRMLYDNVTDPDQCANLAGLPEHAALEETLESTLQRLMAERGDDLHPSTYYKDWYDQERRVIRNAFGALSHPDTIPDWSLLRSR